MFFLLAPKEPKRAPKTKGPALFSAAARLDGYRVSCATPSLFSFSSEWTFAFADIALMKQAFQIGDIQTYTHVVTEVDTARFPSGEVHAVYSTFALARDAEWSGRLFVLDMKEGDEEGIGTGITVEHASPALVWQEVTFTATLMEVNGNEVITDYAALVGDRLVAKGRQWQKILKREKLDRLFASLKEV